MLLITHNAQIPHRPKPWNKGKLVGPKRPFKLREIWAIRIRLQVEGTNNDSQGLLDSGLVVVYRVYP
jgi:hypothetical protein